MTDNVKSYLDALCTKFNNSLFLENDPLSIPHRFSTLQDIEITAFWTSMLAWGQRTTIINSANRLFSLMDNAPFDFIKNHTETDRARFLSFKHRTFQPDDTLYFLQFFQNYYQTYDSLEQGFAQFLSPDAPTTELALSGFHNLFFNSPLALKRTRKHVATPESGSTCKRLNMFLRWMVRPNTEGVDFGLWKNIKPAQLLIPLDVHVDRQARRLQLLTRPQTDWKAVIELTDNLRQFDPNDPVKYDFALFGLGILEKKGLTA